MNRVTKTEVGVEPGVVQPDNPNVTIHLNRDPNDPRIVKKTRLVSGEAYKYVGQERVRILKVIKEN